MYFKKLSKDKAYFFYHLEDAIYTDTFEGLIKMDLNLKSLANYKDSDNLKYSYYDGSKFYFEDCSNDKYNLFFDNELNFLGKIESESIFPRNPESKQVICSKYENKTKTISLYDLEKQKSIWEKDTSSKYEWRNYNIFDQHMVYTTDRDKTVFNFANKLTGEVLWNFDLYKDMKLSGDRLEEKAGVHRFIGLHQSILLTGLSNGFLLGIDVETGRQSFVIEQSEDSVTGEKYKGLRGEMFYKLSPDRKKLVALHGDTYSVFDLNSMQAERVRKMGNDMKEKIGNVLLVRDFTIVNEQEIVFTAGVLGRAMDICKIGVFNPQTEQVEWLHDMGFENGVSFNAGNVPYVIGNRIYINDNKGTLYVFEKV